MYFFSHRFKLLTNNKVEPFPALVPSTQVELDLYEKFYNDEIFYPSWQRMIEEVDLFAVGLYNKLSIPIFRQLNTTNDLYLEVLIIR